MRVPYYDDELFVSRVNESSAYYPSLMILCDYRKNRMDLIFFRQLWECKNEYNEKRSVSKEESVERFTQF